jgi:hypothetical protein
MRGWASGCGTGKSFALADVASWGSGGVLIRRGEVVAGRGAGFGGLVVRRAVDAVEVMVVAVRAGDVVALVAAGEPAPQPARTRQARVLAVAVALGV